MGAPLPAICRMHLFPSVCPFLSISFHANLNCPVCSLINYQLYQLSGYVPFAAGIFQYIVHAHRNSHSGFSSGSISSSLSLSTSRTISVNARYNVIRNTLKSLSPRREEMSAGSSWFSSIPSLAPPSCCGAATAALSRLVHIRKPVYPTILETLCRSY